jgi:protein SCO1/2
MLRLFQITTGLLVGLLLLGAAVWLLGDGSEEFEQLPLPPAMEASVREGLSSGWAGTPYPDPQPLPAFSLTDHLGQPVDNARIAGRYQVLFFGYTHCPDVCPATLLHLGRARRMLDPEQADRLGGVLVTVDPARDTPNRLARYLSAFDEAVIGVTGPEEEMARFAEAMGVGYFQVPTDDPDGPWGAYTIDHTARTFVLDPDGRIVHSFPPFLTGEAMAGDLRRIMNGEEAS